MTLRYFKIVRSDEVVGNEETDRKMKQNDIMKQALNQLNKRATIIVRVVIAGLLLQGCSEVDYNSYVPVNPAPVIEQVDETVLLLNLQNVDQEIFGNYYNNYGTFEIDDTEYEGYSIGTDNNDDSELFVLRAEDYCADIPVLAASFANVESLAGISSISIAYESADDCRVYYGNDRNSLKYSYQLPKSDDYSEQTIDCIEESSYFRIEAGDEDLYVDSLELTLTGNGADDTKEYAIEGLRYIPETDYNPYEGEVLSAPICEIDNQGNVTIIDWRDYTYHSFDFARDEIEENGADESDFALTDPVDVANYFVLFNRIPANYGLSAKSDYDKTRIQGKTESVEEVYELFGQDTRQVSEYIRNDGYTQTIPVAEINKTKTGILYYEFDVDIDGKYSTDKRGTGRVVGFVGGFVTNEDASNVALYTDDHYYTFTEFNNCGGWNDRFDAEAECRTGKNYGTARAIEIGN